MFTDTANFDICYNQPCKPVNQLPTMSGGVTGTFVSGGITYKYHTWGTNEPFITGSAGSSCTEDSGVFTVQNMGNICTVQLLVVGGGGGVLNSTGGGGGGQVVYVPNFPIRRQTYCCKRGNGGSNSVLSERSGSDSIFYLDLFPYKPSLAQPYQMQVVAKGGGGAGGTSASAAFPGQNGGSGAGGAGTFVDGGPTDRYVKYNCTGTLFYGGGTGSAIYNTSLYYYGSNGGCGAQIRSASYTEAGGGGGGALTSGSSASGSLVSSFGQGFGGNGGNGIGFAITSSELSYFGGGGGGGSWGSLGASSLSGSGGRGGGGNGGQGTFAFPGHPGTPIVAATPGIDFTGGGGGGGGGWRTTGSPPFNVLGGAAGGAGTIIITYKYQLD